MKVLKILFPLLLFLTESSSTAGVVVRLWYDDLTTRNSYFDVGLPPEIALLTTRTRFPDMPNGTSLMTLALDDQEGLQPYLSGSQTPGGLPTQYHDWFRTLIRGYIEIPQTGEYIFWVLGDDGAELRLSRNHSRTTELAAVCPTASRTDYDRFESQRSEPFLLQRGQKIYFELMHWEFVNRDRVAVGWRLPDGTIQRPIPGRYLAPLPLQETTTPDLTNQDILPRYVVAEGVAPKILQTNYFNWPINGQPTNLVVGYGGNGLFQTTYEASQPAHCQWRRDGKPISGEILSSLEVRGVGPEDHGAIFDVVITNAFGAVTSNPAILYVDQMDAAFLTVVSAATRGNPNGVDVTFSRPIERTSALAIENYSLARLENNNLAPISITGAKLIGTNAVRISASLPEGFLYQITVSKVKDAPGGIEMVPGVVSFLQVQGAVQRRAFFEIGPTPTVESLLTASKFVNEMPDDIDYLPSLGSPLNPFGATDGYGTQLRGYLTAPLTGFYFFSIAANDQATLFLSTSEQPSQKREIAMETTPRGYRNYNPLNPAANTGDPAANLNNLQGSKISGPIQLTAGQKYYIEVLHKDAVGDDHVNVAWQKPGDPPVVDGTDPIGMEHLSSFETANGPVQITRSPQNLNINETEPAEFSVGVGGSPIYRYQWFVNGEAIPGANLPVYRIGRTFRTDHLSKFSVQVKNGFSMAESQQVTLTINFDSDPPQLLSVSGSPSGDRLFLWFSEPLEPASAVNLSNYSLSLSGSTTEAILSDSGNQVILKTSPLLPGAEYTLTVQNLADRSPGANPMPPTEVKFTAWEFRSGVARVAYFRDIPGEDLASLFAATHKFPDNPDEVSMATALATRANYGDHFGAKICGFLIPSKTGNYRFYARSRNASEFFISSTGSPDQLPTTPDVQTQGTSEFNEIDASFGTYSLQANTRYYFEGFLKAGEGPDFFEVAWKEAEDSTPPAELRPISAEELGVFLDPEASAEIFLSIVKSGQSVIISWPPEALGWRLEAAGSISSSSWIPIPNSESSNSIQLPASQGSSFFRLAR